MAQPPPPTALCLVQLCKYFGKGSLIRLAQGLMFMTVYVRERETVSGGGRGVWSVCVLCVCYACLVCVYFNAVEWSYLIGSRLLLDFLFIYIFFDFPAFSQLICSGEKWFFLFLFLACCVCDSSLICLCDFIKYLSSSVVVKSPAMTRPFACQTVPSPPRGTGR